MWRKSEFASGNSPAPATGGAAPSVSSGNTHQELLQGRHSVTPLPTVSTCANPNCKAQFKRLGEGEMRAFRIDHPQLWGLPGDAKQKVIWLCNQCSLSMYVRLDRHQHVIQFVHKGGDGRRPAA
jgi:hypothetical protein